MRRIMMKLEYDGSAYRGWQVQPSGTTIQGLLEGCILRITGQRTAVIGAGRTDAGVHALGQVATFDSSSRLSCVVLKRALNALLPRDIRVLDLSEVAREFHARHDAVRKRYVYLIGNTRQVPVFIERYVWWIRDPLDTEGMRDAARSLVGRYDYSSFRAAGCTARSPVREVFALGIERTESIPFLTATFAGNYLGIGIEAEGFLRHMVRNIVGTLVEVGRGRLDPEAVGRILACRDRQQAGPAAPAQGLFLDRVDYPL